jgi:hypothetical protein
VQDQLSKLVTMSERSIASCEFWVRRDDNYGFSIKDVILELNGDKYFKTKIVFNKRFV